MNAAQSFILECGLKMCQLMIGIVGWKVCEVLLAKGMVMLPEGSG